MSDLSQIVEDMDSLKQEIERLKKEKEQITAFALDYQLWVKDFILSLDIKDDFHFMTFQGMRRQAYTHAKQSGRTPKWGDDENYFDSQFGYLSGLENKIDRLNDLAEQLKKENARLDEENSKIAYSLSQSVPVESSLEQYDRIKELEEIISNEELLRQHMNSIGYRELCKLKEELQVTKEQLEKAEKVIKLVASRRCSPMVDSAIDTYLYKQKDEVKGE